jgi:hypothetical protein
MRRLTAHIGVGVLVLGGVTVALAPPAGAGGDHGSEGADPVVVVTGLDNPRQLGFGPDDTLLIAEAGSGGDTCVTPPPVEGAPPEFAGPLCAGTSGGISSVQDPDDVYDGTAQRVVDGLFSVAGPDGSFAGGSSGVDATDLPGEYIIAENGSAAIIPPELAAVPGSDQVGHLVVAETEGGEQFLLPYADIAAAEAEENPDGAQVDSNAYATLFVDPTPEGEPGTDGYALVADAGANTVWRVTPDFAAVPDDCTDETCIPPYEITVFATYETTEGDDVTPEFVPTSLAADAAGNVYVGGLGSEVTGAAEIRQYSADGEQTNGWGGFTSISGLAVDPEGEHLYVSQLFGSTPEQQSTGPMGNVVRVDTAEETYQWVDVPFPAGVALDDRGRVYVSAYSISPADGVPASDLGPALPGGQVWRISFEGAESDFLPVFFPHDTAGAWEPAGQAVSPQPGVCGTGVFLAPGDLGGEWRVTRTEDFDRIEYRGAATADILGPDGSVLVDELDVSGSGSELYRADGFQEFRFEAPNLVFGFPEELETFAAAGLPDNFYYTAGVFEETISPEGEVTLISAPTDAVDICSLLPAS